jgi:hypothetical protein
MNDPLDESNQRSHYGILHRLQMLGGRKGGNKNYRIHSMLKTAHPRRKPNSNFSGKDHSKQEVPRHEDISHNRTSR